MNDGWVRVAVIETIPDADYRYTEFDLRIHRDDLLVEERAFVRGQLSDCFSQIWDTEVEVTFSDERSSW